MGRPLLVSSALHVALALIAFAIAQGPPSRERKAAPDELALVPPPPAPPAPPVADVEVVALPGGGGPPRPSSAPRSHAPGPRPPIASVPAHAAPEAPPPEIAGAVEVATAPHPDPLPADGERERESDPLAPAAGKASDDRSGSGDGDGSGDGVGSGDGDGIGPGSGPMGRELHARVLGDERVDVRPRDGMPVIDHDEATALRKRDIFPRLPESVWASWRPYIVKLEICVGEDGRVREAALRSSASPRLDPLVLAAARTWLYRPRVVDGKPAPFCHGVAIKYERW